MERWLTVNKTLAFAVGSGADGHVLAEDSMQIPSPGNQLCHALSANITYSAIYKQQDCKNCHLSAHCAVNGFGVRTPTLGRCR